MKFDNLKKCEDWNSKITNEISKKVSNDLENIKIEIKNIKVENGKYHLKAMNNVNTQKEALYKFKEMIKTFEDNYDDQRKLIREDRNVLANTINKFKELEKDIMNKFKVY